MASSPGFFLDFPPSRRTSLSELPSEVSPVPLLAGLAGVSFPEDFGPGFGSSASENTSSSVEPPKSSGASSAFEAFWGFGVFGSSAPLAFFLSPAPGTLKSSEPGGSFPVIGASGSPGSLANPNSRDNSSMAESLNRTVDPSRIWLRRLKSRVRLEALLHLLRGDAELLRGFLKGDHSVRPWETRGRTGGDVIAPAPALGRCMSFMIVNRVPTDTSADPASGRRGGHLTRVVQVQRTTALILGSSGEFQDSEDFWLKIEKISVRTRCLLSSILEPWNCWNSELPTLLLPLSQCERFRRFPPAGPGQRSRRRSSTGYLAPSL